MALHAEKGRITELRVPVNCPWTDVHGFLREKFDWIQGAERELEKVKLAPRDRFESGGIIRYLGQPVRLSVFHSQFNVIELGDNGLDVFCRSPDRAELLEKQVLGWLRREAEIIFAQRLAELNQLFLDRISPGPLSIRKMRARWGSCSINGDICLNLLLMREAPAQIDTVIAHELCHLRHFSHSRAFYDLLTEVMPDWRLREKKLGKGEF